jgi:hypothetical protein
MGRFALESLALPFAVQLVESLALPFAVQALDLCAFESFAAIVADRGSGVGSEEGRTSVGPFSTAIEDCWAPSVNLRTSSFVKPARGAFALT